MPSYTFPSSINHQTVDGEVIAIHFGNGTYYSMREGAAAVWEAIAAGIPTEQIATVFAHPPVDADAQISVFIGQLQAADLLVAPTGEARAIDSPTPTQGTAAWSPLVLEAFDDLSQLLLADPIHDVTEEAWPNLKETQA